MNSTNTYSSEDLKDDKIAFALGHLNRHITIQSSKIDGVAEKIDLVADKTDTTNEKLDTLIDAIDGMTDALNRIGDILAQRL